MDKTKSKRICAWDKWCKFLRSIGLRSDVFLDELSCWRIRIVLVSFAQIVRRAEFSQGPKKRLVAETVRDTVGHLSQAFKADLIDDPRRNPYGSLSFLLEHIFKGYANKYPGVKPQNTIQIIILLKVLDLAQTELATAMADIV